MPVVEQNGLDYNTRLDKVSADFFYVQLQEFKPRVVHQSDFLTRAKSVLQAMSHMTRHADDKHMQLEMAERLEPAMRQAALMLDLEPVASMAKDAEIIAAVGISVASSIVQQASGIYNKQCHDANVTPKFGTPEEQKNAEYQLFCVILESIDDIAKANLYVWQMFVAWIIADATATAGVRTLDVETSELERIIRRTLGDPDVMSDALNFTNYYYHGPALALWMHRLGVLNMSADELRSLIISTIKHPGARAKAAKSGPRRSIPKQQPQYTFQEAHRLGLAIMDMKTLNNFEMLSGEVALVHTLDKYRHQVKVTPGQMPELFGWEPITSPYSQYLRLGSTLLTQQPIDLVFLMHTVIGMALQHERCTVDIDDFIPALGWQPHKGKTKEREEMRMQIWQWLLVLEASQIIGARGGVYRDPAGKPIQVESWDPFIRITGKEFEIGRQMRLDKIEAPLRVSFVAGETLNRFRGNSKILSFIGNIRKVGQLPSGKPKKAWARSICLALHQIWRTNASNAQESRTGDEKNKPSAKIARRITRYELLSMFAVEPYVEEVINAPNPQRAVQYWDGAIKALKSPPLDIISYHQSMGRRLDRNARWTKEDYRYWLFEQPLDIRPSADTTAAILEIARRAKTARRSRSRKKKATDS